MTVGIGAYSLSAKSIVLAADTRTTYGKSPTGPHDQTAKQFPLPPFNCAAVIAGSVTESHEFIGRLVQLLAKFKKKSPDRQDMMKAIDDARWRVYRPKLNWAFKADLGMSLAQWHKGFMPPNNVDLFNPQAEYFGRAVISANPLKTSCIVGGFIEPHTMFFCAKGMKHIQAESNPAIYAIGSGSIHAIRKLNKRQQNPGFGLARTLYHIHEAMLAARQEKTVGPPNNYVILTKDEPIKWVAADCQLLKDWRRHYRHKETYTLDSNPYAKEMLEWQFRAMPSSISQSSQD